MWPWRASSAAGPRYPAYIPCVSYSACGFIHFVSSEHALTSYKDHHAATFFCADTVQSGTQCVEYVLFLHTLSRYSLL